MNMKTVLEIAKRALKKALKAVKKLDRKLYPFDIYTRSKPKKDWNIKYAKYVRKQQVEPNWIFYESHGGSGMLCNPYAIFRAFQKMPEFSQYLHIWVIRDKDEKERLRKEYKHLKNVLFVYYQSTGYAYFLAKSKYLINNTSYYSVFSKRDEQIYVNTWHSITVKALGYDMPDGRRLVNNMLRNLLMADYIISPNRFMTDIFNNAFRLREICESKILEIGYPRNDLVVNSDRERVFSKLEERGTVVDRNKKIILYAPTWNGNNVSKPKIDCARYTNMCEYFAQHVNMDEYQLLIKPHQIEYRNFPAAERESGKYVSYTIDANELLSVVDVLITDYSSIYFDYMLADKPILFYIPDFEAYSAMRGIYFTKEELPGPCCSDFAALAAYINNIDRVTEEYKQIRHDTQAWASEFDDGHVAERVLDIVFRGNENYNIKSAEKTGKKRILFYMGGLATNGVTSAALSLLKAIDYSQYDVSVFVVGLKDSAQNRMFDSIPADVRTIMRTSKPVLATVDKECYSRMLKEGIPENEEERMQLQWVMRREFVRIFGNAPFDYLIDFSGYGSYIPALFTLGYSGKNAKFYMWQHNDMLMDYSNQQKMTLNANDVTIEALLSCYARMDKVVSATKDVYEANLRKLATPEIRDKFTYCTNLLDPERFAELAKEENILCHSDCIEYVQDSRVNGMKTSTIFPLKQNQIKFVTMGRCMPEKNHEGIIRALKRLCDEGHDAVIYIIGDGHLRTHLEELAAELGIAERVFITGMLQNPMALLKRCDCFVFPSIYEAQGLGVLEARTVGLPIIVSNYEAVGSVLLDDQQYILKGTDADSIYEGMQAFIQGKIPCDYNFSVEKYNERGIGEFYKLLS